jgi:hypothetical protein
MKRSTFIWRIEQVARLSADLYDALKRYEAYCHEAAAIAPEKWRTYWAEEAKRAYAIRNHLFDITSIWLSYASGRDIESLGEIERTPPLELRRPGEEKEEST